MRPSLGTHPGDAGGYICLPIPNEIFTPKPYGDQLVRKFYFRW